MKWEGGGCFIKKKHSFLLEKNIYLPCVVRRGLEDGGVVSSPWSTEGKKKRKTYD